MPNFQLPVLIASNQVCSLFLQSSFKRKIPLLKFTISTIARESDISFLRSCDRTVNNKPAHKYDFRKLWRTPEFFHFRSKSINARSARRISCCARGFRQGEKGRKKRERNSKRHECTAENASNLRTRHFGVSGFSHFRGPRAVVSSPPVFVFFKT